MDIIDDAVNPDQNESLKKKLDKVELKKFFHDIDEQCLITLPE